jgi:MFS transporter, FHS family, L-fucose permease
LPNPYFLLDGKITIFLHNSYFYLSNGYFFMTTNKTSNASYTGAMVIVASLFFIFGFVTWLNGTLIPFLKKACELSDLQSYFVATAFFAAYFVMALPSSAILKKTGTKKGMSLGLVVMAIGTCLFIPAANSRDFNLFLIGFFIQGSGLALLQTAANPYVTVIGPIESAAQRISIMGICNKFAGIIGSLIFGSILLSNSDEIQTNIEKATDLAAKEQLLTNLATRINTPYSILAFALLVCAFIIYRSKLSDITESTNEDSADDLKLTLGKSNVFQFPHVWLGFLAIFFYVAAEVMAGDLISTYGKNLGFSSDTTKFFTSFGLGGLLIGYIVSIILIPKYMKQELWLSVCAILGLILTICSYFANENAAVFCLAALGFANAVMWPAIFPLGIKNLGRFTNIGGAFLIMGIVGGAVVPPLYGWLYEKANIGLDFRSAFVVVMSICYIYIFWFGTKGHKSGNVK